MNWILVLFSLVAFLAARCVLLLLIKTKYRSKSERVKTMIVLGSGRVLAVLEGRLQLQLRQPVTSTKALT
jgi:hypothetical protein